MADVSATLRLWSATPSSNNPSGSTAIGTGLDDNLREIQAVVRKYLASKGSDIASSATTDLSSMDGFYAHVTGTTTITAFGTEAAGISYLLEFDSALTLTHNATSLILPGAVNITTATGDMAFMVSEGSGNWRCAFYLAKENTPVSKIVTARGDLLRASAARTLERVALGTIGYVLRSDGTDPVWDEPLTLGTEQASTSGTSIDFTDIPSWVRRITIPLVGVSVDATAAYLVQIGDSGGVETSGYFSGAAQLTDSAAISANNSTAGFLIAPSVTAGATLHGAIVLTLEDAANNTWVSSGNLGFSNSATVDVSGGSKSLSGTLDRVRITTVAGTAAFDAGAINVMWE